MNGPVVVINYREIIGAILCLSMIAIFAVFYAIAWVIDTVNRWFKPKVKPGKITLSGNPERQDGNGA